MREDKNHVLFCLKYEVLKRHVCGLFCVPFFKIQSAMPHGCDLLCVYPNSKYCRSVCLRANASRTAPLACQRKSQITRYFTTQMIHYHKLKSDSEDYKTEQVRVFYLPSLFVVLKGLTVTGCRCLRFYKEAYFPLFLSSERALSITCSAKPICLKTPPESGINIRHEDLNICSRKNAYTVSVFSYVFLPSSQSHSHRVMSFCSKAVPNGPMPLLCCSVDLLVG